MGAYRTIHRQDRVTYFEYAGTNVSWEDRLPRGLATGFAALYEARTSGLSCGRCGNGSLLLCKVSQSKGRVEVVTVYTHSVLQA